jgi:hypothetical protein
MSPGPDLSSIEALEASVKAARYSGTLNPQAFMRRIPGTHPLYQHCMPFVWLNELPNVDWKWLGEQRARRCKKQQIKKNRRAKRRVEKRRERQKIAGRKTK